MRTDLTKQIAECVEKIKLYEHSLDNEARRLRPPQLSAIFDKTNPHHWCLSIVGDGLVRTRLLIEQRFHFIESLGIVAASRYLLELNIWLNLFNKDERYGLVYYDQLIDTQKGYYQSTLDQLLREIELLNEFDKKEKDECCFWDKDGSIDDAILAVKNNAKQIDREAARRFSIYTEQAKYNGYGFQAYLISQQSIPPIRTALNDIATERKYFDENILSRISDLLLDKNKKKRRWNWREMAEVAGLGDEYAYIYSFSSKILHATPASITTDQKNLETEEMLVFIKYIEVKLADLVDISKQYDISTA